MKIPFLVSIVLATLLFGCADDAPTENSEEADETLVAEEAVEEEATPCEGKDSFIPNGYKIIKEAKGDLNKDGIDDWAIVAMGSDKKYLEDDGYMTMDSNPRTLLILFGTKEKSCYTLAKKSSTFILRHEEINMQDPFEDIEISKGTLHLSYVQFANMGSWETSSYKYIWRYQDGDFKLIGANSSSFHRADGDATDISVNFSTKKYSVTTFNNFDESVAEEEKWYTLDLKQLPTFETFKKPWGWEVADGVYL